MEKPFSEKLERAKKLIRLLSKTRFAVSCSFGKDSSVVLYLVRQLVPKTPVLFCNTGVEFQETLRLKDRLTSEWDLNLVETKPEKSYWQVMDQLLKDGKPIPDGAKKSDICCYWLKEKPMRSVLRSHGFTHNFTGITALESRLREFVACQRGMEYFSRKDNVWRVHPIMFWTPEEVWSFTKENSIPVNEAYERYKLDRIGCMPCTSHRFWREQLSRVNPKMYKLISERYFKQKLLF